MQIQSINAYNSQNTAKNGIRKQKTPAFKRAWEEHISWGANYIKNTGKTNFKLFSFPDAKTVLVEITKNTKIKLANMWEHFVNVKPAEKLAMAAASSAAAVPIITTLDNNTKLYPMEHKGNGIFEAKDIDAKPDDGYRFIVVKKDGSVSAVKDPYSKKQENIHGWSSVYDSDNYEWKNTDWLEGKDPRRIKRNSKSAMRGLEKLIIDEVNIPTLSLSGTFKDAKARVDEIAKRKNATAIELMPVENTFSQQWGYDGVDKFAVNEKLGGAKGLKELVDYAHGKGLNVIMDMVPNHIGTDGNYLGETGPYTKGASEFGDKLNYEGQNNKYVRDWMANAALWWANEFKVDGLRFDLTNETDSDWLLRQIVVELNQHNPNVFLIAEDHQHKRHAITSYYENDKISHQENLSYIDNQVEGIAKGFPATAPLSIGFDSEWDSDYKDALENVVLTPGNITLDALDKFLPTSHYRIHYAYSHDEIGNEDGTRFIPKYLVRHLDLFGKVNGYGDCEKGQNAAKTAQKLSELVISNNFVNMNRAELADYEKHLGLNTFITKDALRDAFLTAVAKQRLIQGTIYTTPGPKMFFQGDDDLDLSYFRFFRDFSPEFEMLPQNQGVTDRINAEKGYNISEKVSRPISVVGNTKPEGIYKDISNQMIQFHKDLRKVMDENPAIYRGGIVHTFKDNNYTVHIHQIKSGEDEILVIKNYGQGFHDNSYGYHDFPDNNSKWEEIFSSDEEKYGGMGYSNKGRKDISRNNQNLSLAPNSFIILRKIK